MFYFYCNNPSFNKNEVREEIKNQMKEQSLSDEHKKIIENILDKFGYYSNELSELFPYLDKNADYFSVEEIFPKTVYPVLDLFLGSENREKFLEFVAFLPNISYASGYSRKFITSKNYQNYFQKISFAFQNFSILHLLKTDVLKVLKGEVFIGKEKINVGYEPIFIEIQNGNTEVINFLKEMMTSETNFATLTDSIFHAIFCCKNAELLELMGKLLLAAKLQEGLRQSIAERMDEGIFENFCYIFKICQENDLFRFSSMKRALWTWIGAGDYAGEDRITKKIVQNIGKMIENENFADELLKSDDNIEVLLGMWRKSINGDEVLVKNTAKFLEKGKKHLDLLSSYFLKYFKYNGNSKIIAKNIFRKYGKTEKIGKDELEILACYENILMTGNNWNFWNYDIGSEEHENAVKSFENIFENKEEIKEFIEIFENVVNSMEKSEMNFEPCIFPWHYASIYKTHFTGYLIILTILLDDAELLTEKLEKYFNFTNYRDKVLSRYLYNPKSKKEKDLVVKSLSKADTSDIACKIILKNNFVAEYKSEIEKNLALKTAEVRINSIKLLFSLKEKELFEITEKLITAKSEQKIIGGLDLLLKAKNENKNIPKNILEIVKNLETENSEIENYISQITEKNAEKSEKLFYDADYKPQIEYSVKRKFEPKEIFEILWKDSENSAKNILKKLDELITKHENYEYKTAWGEEVFLGNEYRVLKYHTKDDKYLEICPLPEVWKNFYETEIKDYKKLFAIKVIICDCGDSFIDDWRCDNTNGFGEYFTNLAKEILGFDLQEIYKVLTEQKLKYFSQIKKIIEYLEEYYRDDEYRFEAGKSLVSYAYENFGEKLSKTYKTSWGDENTVDVFYVIRPLTTINSGLFKYKTKENFEEYFSLAYNFGLHIGSEDLPLAVIYGKVKIDYFYQKLLEKENRHFWNFSNLYFYEKNYNDFSKENFDEILAFTKENFGALVDYILQTELKRGEEETEVSGFIGQIRKMEGLAYFMQILNALGKIKLSRNTWCWGKNTKQWNLSHLLKVSIPNPEDSDENFKKAIQKIKITDQRLVEVALYSPKWIPFIEKYLGWKGLASACYYFHAHISDVSKKEEATFAKYSPISIQDFADGAFDIDWFSSAYSELGEEKFMMLYEAAKYVSDGAKHSRARKFADAVLGKLEISELEKNISDKRNQDSVKAYGLIPFANQKKDLVARYTFLQKFLKESKNFGAQRRASEAKAVQISLENLARNAGFSDVTRLICFVETDLLEQNQSYFEPKNLGEIEIFIEITNGKSEIVYQKGEKRIKSLPAKYKKDEYVLEIKEIHKNLKDQYSRSKKMFEKSMEDAVEFFGYEIKNLMEKNIIVAPILKDLVLKKGEILGFYQNGKIVSIDGKTHDIKDEDTLKIAHCLDIFKSGDWALYQKYLFENEIKQAFKQIFRELYTKTDDEMDKFHSMRYAGYQIQASKTVATLKTRSWHIEEYTGLEKVYHKENIIAKIYSEADWFSPAEIEAPSIDYVVFYDRKTGEEITIKDVPELIFSEVMRDVDLAVSVAYVGGVDPETSSSTIEMRKAIFTFNLELFGLKNVTFSEKHAIIEGKMGEYTVHLGSGVIHQKAGSAISVLPVHSAHRGKIFLPFIDEDPKTSEIMTKILFFAEDTKIKDPAILSQIQKV